MSENSGTLRALQSRLLLRKVSTLILCTALIGIGVQRNLHDVPEEPTAQPLIGRKRSALYKMVFHPMSSKFSACPG